MTPESPRFESPKELHSHGARRAGVLLLGIGLTTLLTGKGLINNPEVTKDVVGSIFLGFTLAAAGVLAALNIRESSQ